MTVRDLLTAELTLEAAFTRMHLERVPMDRLDYKAHDKSMTLGWLATFLAIMPTWGGYTPDARQFRRRAAWRTSPASGNRAVVGRSPEDVRRERRGRPRRAGYDR